jgi:small subunit ribosomal protein S10
MAAIEYKIKLSSYDVALLEKTIQDILNTAKRVGATVTGPIPLPTKREV